MKRKEYLSPTLEVFLLGKGIHTTPLQISVQSSSSHEIEGLDFWDETPEDDTPEGWFGPW